MKCISCETPNVFNRVVINRLSGEQIGAYCDECEVEFFGDLLNKPGWHQSNGCAFCDNSGKYKLPIVECIIEYAEGEANFDYSNLDDCAALCTKHTKSLCADPSTISDTKHDEDDALLITKG